ncbi:hypothetical protein [Sphingobacterium kitahiroshimense]|uniref:Uncharacterized protein n=1 Tax=Sphingobacterium kitahiroshimense TaxID=470446 RepID=A0ABV0BY75_9SPHI
MKNSKLKEEFEQVNESSGTSPHRYGKEAFKKENKRSCNKNLFWLGGAIIALAIWKYCDSRDQKNSILTMLSGHKSSCTDDLKKLVSHR